ncbi:hypothetical protein [Hymenobacter sp. HDW8]|uniref:hypothetical protein n=1 Tax=Hymenobacter sp. HDW8 TaxID=2714932 RepID=UPI0014078D5E|nr:hypothetical protein [Hymenobacter sp. HDW8]QIL78443.1 hypothetical protein G7064_21725 [Hymenobacter sp. HDW8]
MPSSSLPRFSRATVSLGLTYGWSLCVLLTFIDWLTPLEFANQALVTALHWVIWGGAIPLARRWPAMRWLPKLLWRSVLLPLPLWAVLSLWPVGIGLVPISFLYFFFFGTNASPASWQTTYVYARQQHALVAEQTAEPWAGFAKPITRTVKITPVTPLFNWVIGAAGEQHPAGWKVVEKAGIYLGPDSTKQLLADAYKAGQQRCQAEQHVQDSIARISGGPAFTLPPITRHGAGTLGFVLGDEVWRNYRTCFTGTGCTNHCPVQARCVVQDKAKGIYSLQLEAQLQVGDRQQDFTLWVRRITGPGVYQIAHYAPSEARGTFELLLHDRTQDSSYRQSTALADQSLREGPSQAVHGLPVAAQLLITRFDTTAHIIAGTFTGQLRNTHGWSKPMLVREGRFDARYRVVKPW